MKQRILILAGILGLVALLAGAAFVGARLFRHQQQAQANNNTQGLPRKLVTPAAGVLTTSPDARGDVTRRDGNSIFICDPTNNLSINPDGTVNKSGGCGPETEVIIGHATVFLHDVTAQQYVQATMPRPGEDMVLQQAVEPGSENDIGEGTAVRAWGTRSGTRLIAHTLLYWNRSPRPSGTPGS
jgi:hypothetical protein